MTKTNIYEDDFLSDLSEMQTPKIKIANRCLYDYEYHYEFYNPRGLPEDFEEEKTETKEKQRYVKKPELSEEEKKKREEQAHRDALHNKFLKQQKKLKEQVQQSKTAKDNPKPKSEMKLVKPTFDPYIQNKRMEELQAQLEEEEAELEAEEAEGKTLDDILDEFFEPLVKENQLKQPKQIIKQKVNAFIEDGKAVTDWRDAPKVLACGKLYASRTRGEREPVPVQTAGEAQWFYNKADSEKYIEKYGELFKGYTFRELKPVAKVRAKKRRGISTYIEIDRLTEEDVVLEQRIVFNQKTRSAIFEKYKGKCAICGQELDKEKFEVDHILPLSRGGTNDLDNLQCTCSMCNRLKGDYTDEEMRNHFLRLITMMSKQNGKFREKIKDVAQWL